MNHDEQILWIDASKIELCGKGWTDAAAPFERLPSRYQNRVSPTVWDLSRQSAGLCLGFRTTSTFLWARWTVELEERHRPMMSAVSTSGLDLYARDSCGGWRWAAVGIPQARETETRMLNELPSESREFLLYLPLRNVLTKLEIGVNRQAGWQPLLPFSGKPIVCYGTSIVHGEGASRPGMTHAAILGRRLNRPIINLGFAGSAIMDLPIAGLMGEIDAAMYLVDCLPNMVEPMISERAEPFVRELRARRPEIPIVLIEDRTYANTWLHPDYARRHQTSRQALRAAYERLRASGMTNLHYIPGDNLLGDDDEATVDSSHPTDLGYFRLASALQSALELLLQ